MYGLCTRGRITLLCQDSGEHLHIELKLCIKNVREHLMGGRRFTFGHYPNQERNANFQYFLDKSCPGDQAPCNGNGQCDLITGVCSCLEGHQGSDCSGNTFS